MENPYQTYCVKFFFHLLLHLLVTRRNGCKLCHLVGVIGRRLHLVIEFPGKSEPPSGVELMPELLVGPPLGREVLG